MKKKTNKEIKKKLAEYNYGLISEYLSAHEKIKIICPEGHIYDTTWANFSQGKRCPKCSLIKMANKRKHSEEFIKSELAKEGYKLLSKYQGCKIKIKVQCSLGHKYEVVWSNFQQGKRCPKCMVKKNSLDQKHSEEFIKSELAKEGYKLLSKYINANTKIIIECCDGHRYSVTYSNFYQGARCPHCVGNVKKNIKNIQKLAEKMGGECLSKKYVNARTSLKWKCHICDYIWNATPSHIQQGHWCPQCAGNAPKTTEQVKIELEKKGYELLSKYKNSNTKLKIKCPKGHIYWASWGKFQVGNRCPQCYVFKSEEEFRKIIEKMLCGKFPKVKPKWLLNDNGNRLELDGYNRILKIAFEYQGVQHFQTTNTNYFGGKNALVKRQRHDQIKKEICEKRGIILLCPTYELDKSEYEDFIKENLNGCMKWG